LYRTMLRLRRELRLGEGTLTWVNGFGDDVVAFRVGSVLVLANLGTPIAVPGGEVLLVTADLADGLIQTDVTAWLGEG